MRTETGCAALNVGPARLAKRLHELRSLRNRRRGCVAHGERRLAGDLRILRREQRLQGIHETPALVHDLNCERGETCVPEVQLGRTGVSGADAAEHGVAPREHHLVLGQCRHVGAVELRQRHVEPSPPLTRRPGEQRQVRGRKAHGLQAARQIGQASGGAPDPHATPHAAASTGPSDYEL